MIFRSFSLAFLLLTVSIMSAQSNKEPYSINFKTATITPNPNTELFINSYDSSKELMFQDLFFRIIQFYNIPTNITKERLKQAGIELMDYLPNNAYIASISNDFDRNAYDISLIRSIIEIENMFKLSQLLYDENYPEYAFTDDGRISLTVSYFRNLEADAVIAMLNSIGCDVLDRNDFSNSVNIIVHIADIDRVASMPMVFYIEPVGQEPVPENYTGRTLHRSNAIATNYSTGRHYDGSGVVVELQDDGIIGPHIDYAGRIADQFPTSNGGNHGDHCAGILMGAGNVDPKVEGTASGSTLYVYNAPPSYPGFGNIPEDYDNLGVRITSTSYSDGCNIGYNYRARMLDEQVCTFHSLMHVFSAGNDGNSDCGYGAGAGWGNITGGHKTGKNVITVGMVGWDDDISDMSSRGPAHDGRIKPDVVGKGREVYSTVDPNTYTFKTGTSMSCPAVAGTFAQLFQAYREHNSGQDPTSELMRSILLNTADDLGNIGPDFLFGYGRINAFRAVKVIEETRFTSGTVNHGEIISHSLDVPSGLDQLRVMITWTDYPAVQFSDWTLVNNLDMTMTDPVAFKWLPWKLNHYPDPDSLELQAFRGVDDRNNVEQITLDNPQSGTYTINIEGASIPQGPQNYSLVWEFITEDVILTYPVGGESLVPGESEAIRWDTFGDEGTYLLELSMDNGDTWDTIVSGLSGDERYYLWTVPPGHTGKAMMKITKGSSISITEAPFSILGVPCNFSIDWACGEKVHLSWSPVMNATSYEVLTLGEITMVPLVSTINTSVIVTDSNTTSDSWFSVRAFGSEEAIGRRTIAVERQEGSVNCYPTDVMMEAFPTGSWGIYQAGSMDLSNLTVSVVIRNYGSETVSNIPIKYKLNDNDEVSESYSGTIEPNDFITYQFIETIDITNIGNYVLEASVDYPGDLNTSNDVLEYPIEVIDGTTIPLGYQQNFDSWVNCTSAPACDLIICDLEDGWVNLENTVYDQHDWRTYSGTTPSPFTGPKVDHTTGTSSGQYLYMEPSMFCLNREALIHTPCIDLSNSIDPKLSLWYYAWGPDIGQFHVDLFDGNSIIEDICPPIMGNKGEEWKELEVDLSPWNGKHVALRFRGITSCNEFGDFAIDDMQIANITSVDEDNREPNCFVKLYPNPTKNTINVKVIGEYMGAINLEIQDIYGRVVKSITTHKVGYELNTLVNLCGFNNGVYIITGHVENGGVLFMQKVMKL